MQSRLLVLRSLANFLQHALEDSRQGSAASYAWIFASSFATRQAFEEFANVLPLTHSVQPNATFTAAKSVDNSPDLGFVVGNVGTSAAWSLSHIVDGLDAVASATSASFTESGDILSTRIEVCLNFLSLNYTLKARDRILREPCTRSLLPRSLIVLQLCWRSKVGQPLRPSWRSIQSSL